MEKDSDSAKGVIRRERSWVTRPRNEGKLSKLTSTQRCWKEDKSGSTSEISYSSPSNGLAKTMPDRRYLCCRRQGALTLESEVDLSDLRSQVTFAHGGSRTMLALV
jgi:hypothetical protein